MIRNEHFYRTSVLYAIFIAFIFFIIAIIISLTQFIWLDEAYTLNTTSASITQVWNRAINFEGQPPLYFVILRIWRFINDSIFFARLFSIITITISAFLVYILSQKYINAIHPFLIALLFASNTVVLWAALEIRVYGLALLFAILLICLFLEIYTSKHKPSLYKRLLFSGVALLSVYIQYYLAFLLIGNFVFLIINRKWEIARLYLSDMIIPVLGTVFLLINVSEQMSIHSYHNSATLSLSDILAFQFKKLSYYLFSFLNYFNSGILKLVFFAVFFAIILFFIRRNVKSIISRKNYFIILLPVQLVLFTFVLFITDERNIAQRHSISLVLPEIFVLALLLNAIKSVKIRYAILMLVITGNIAFNFVRYSIAKPKGIQYENLSNFIKTNDKENKPVFCFRYDIALILKYGVPNHKVISIPENIDFDSYFNRKKWVLSSPEQLDSLFTVNNIENGFWLATTETDSVVNNSIEKRYEIQYKYEMLNEYISANFNIEMERQFPPGLVLKRVIIPK